MGRPLTRSELIHDLWPAIDRGRGRCRLRSALHVLRRQIERAGVARGSILIYDRKTVRLNDGVLLTDVSEFETAVQGAATSLTGDAKISHLREALRLYGGDFLAGLRSEWARRERGRLHTVFGLVVDELVLLLSDRGRLSSGIPALRYALRADPLREKTQAALLQAYAAAEASPVARRQCELLAALIDR
jgi:two-component SAPR family response regulator